MSSKLRAQIENLKYDRDLLHQQLNTLTGIFNSYTLKQKIKDIDNQIIQLQQQMKNNSKLNRSEGENRKTKILFLASDPKNTSRLRLGEEFREIQEKLKLAKLRDNFQLELPQLSLRVEDIIQALLDTQPQIVHFSGHGIDSGALCFENQSGQTHFVHPNALASLFEQFVSEVNCVVLNACYSEPQAMAISKHIKYVIGMSHEIGDRAAIAFTTGFYQGLGANRSIEDAFKIGCASIRMHNLPDNLIPMLIKQ